MVVKLEIPVGTVIMPCELEITVSPSLLVVVPALDDVVVVGPEADGSNVKF